MSSQKSSTPVSASQIREYLRTHDVARKLGISQKLVIRLIRSGKLPGFQVGRVWLIHRTKLEEYLMALVDSAVKKKEEPQ